MTKILENLIDSGFVRASSFYVCEIKFSSDEFIIDKEYDLKLRNKIEAFKRNTSIKYGLQLTMITTYGVKNNKYSSIIGNQIMLEDLFDA